MHATDSPYRISQEDILANLDLLKKLSAIIGELAEAGGVPKRWVDVERRDGTKDGFWAFLSDVTLSHAAPLFAKHGLGIWPNVLHYDEVNRLIHYQMMVYDSKDGGFFQAMLIHPLDEMDTPTQSWNSSDTTVIKRFLRAICMIYDPTAEDPEFVLAKMAGSKKANLEAVDNQIIHITRIEKNASAVSDRAPKAFLYGYAPEGVGTAEDNLGKLEVGLWEPELKRLETFLGRGGGSIMFALMENGGTIDLTEQLRIQVSARGQYLRMHNGSQPISLDNPAIRYAFIMGSGLEETALLPILGCKESLAEFPHNIQTARSWLQKHYEEIERLEAEQIEGEQKATKRLGARSEKLAISSRVDMDMDALEKEMDEIFGKSKPSTLDVAVAAQKSEPTPDEESLGEVMDRLNFERADKLVSDEVAGDSDHVYNPSHAGERDSEAANKEKAVGIPQHETSDIIDSCDITWGDEGTATFVLGASGGLG